MVRANVSIRRLLVIVVLLGIASTLGVANAETEQERMVRLRQKFFGLDNVDPSTGALRTDRVILSWVNNAGFAGAFNGHVVLLDAFFPDHNPGYVPTNAFELGDLKPEYLFIGHGHGDHAAQAPRVLRRSGVTTLVGTPQHCDQMQDALSAEEVTCVAAVARDAQMGDARALNDLIPGVEITAIKHPHSTTEPPATDDPNGPYVPTIPFPPAYEPRLSNPPIPQEEPDDGTSPGSGAEGGSVLYQFRIDDFSLAYHDTTGPVKVGDATWQAFNELPASDVQVGAVVNFGQLSNGMRDVRILVEALRPRIFVPNHHDDWNPALGSRGDRYERPVREELNKIPEDRRPSVQWIYDPYDYLRPGLFTYDPTAPVWD